MKSDLIDTVAEAKNQSRILRRIKIMYKIKLLLLLFICMTLTANVRATSIIFDTGVGDGEFDKATYAVYQSEITFIPYNNMSVTSLDPYVWYCNGQCFYETMIYDNMDNLLGSLALEKTFNNTFNPEGFSALFDDIVTLAANEEYRIYQHVSTTLSIGIWTTGADSLKVLEDGAYAIISEGQKDRGSIAFTLTGDSTSGPGGNPPLPTPVPATLGLFIFGLSLLSLVAKRPYSLT